MTSSSRLVFASIVLLSVLCLISGCCSLSKASSGQSLITYKFSTNDYSSIVRFRGVVDSAVSHDISLARGGWGMIEMISEEGSRVASGAIIARINMEQIENRLESVESSLRDIDESLKLQQTRGPSEIKKVELALDNSLRELSMREHEKQWLLKGRAMDERWRAQSDVEKAALESEAAQIRYNLQKQVAAKGFDSPFALRSQEIEANSKEVSLGHAKRRLQAINAGPLPEELARADHLIQVASGEAWIAGNEVDSASVSYQIRQQNQIFSKDMQISRSRRLRHIIETRELTAPINGLVIYQTLWGGRKASVGMNVHGSFSFMKVVDDDKYIVDAIVPESVSSRLKEGAVATVTFDAYPEQNFLAKVTLVSRSPKRVVGRQESEYTNFPVQLEVDRNGYQLAIGMKADVEIEVASGTGVFIPRDLVELDNGTARVKYLSGLTGRVSTDEIKVEPFDSDFIRWIDPPAEAGELVY